MAKKQVARGSLHKKAIELLHNRPVFLTVEDIARETDLPEGWINNLIYDRQDDPSVNRVELLVTILEQLYSKEDLFAYILSQRENKNS